jgi:hypothetical protein
MSKREDYVRNFGMTGFLLTEDLRLIEQRFGIKLGHSQQSDGRISAADYPQFEQHVRAEAAEMSQHYELFYCLEQSIRKLVTETLQEAGTGDWWNQKVTQQIQQEVANRIKTEAESGMSQRSEEAIDYTTFGELSEIITTNWVEFTPVLRNKFAVQRVMRSLNLLRNPVAHCCPFSEDEVARLHLAVKDWFRLFG